MASMFPDGIHADGSVYPIVPGGYAVVGEFLLIFFCFLGFFGGFFYTLYFTILYLICLDN